MSNTILNLRKTKILNSNDFDDFDDFNDFDDCVEVNLYSLHVELIALSCRWEVIRSVESVHFILHTPAYSERSGISGVKHWSYAISVTREHGGEIRSRGPIKAFTYTQQVPIVKPTADRCCKNKAVTVGYIATIPRDTTPGMRQEINQFN